MIQSSFPFQTRPARTFLPVGGVAASLLLVALSGAAQAQPTQDWTRTETRDDCADYSPTRNPYFGDLHVHTKYSADSVLIRNRNDPRDAYDFAKGGTVGLTPYDAMDVPTRSATIDRPLDFTAVTDHSEGFGEAVICLDPGYPGYDDVVCSDLRDTFDNIYQPAPAPPQAFVNFFLPLTGENPTRFAGVCGPGPGYDDCATEAGVVWQDTLDAAEENYDRTDACEFTTFPAYEWSANTGGNNLHRNVIFRNAEVPALPISYYEEWTAEGLWSQLQAQCLDEPGNCDVLAIPHNSNIARDMMFARTMTDGNPITAEYAATRSQFEPLVEVFQNKGSAECRDGVSGTADELCGFENLSRQILLGTSNWNQTFSYKAFTRGGLREGLYLENRTGVNPYNFGFIGGTDTHNGTPGLVSERDYGAAGHMGIADSTSEFILSEIGFPGQLEQNGGGVSVVWAEENSRDAIFAALRRRETYATSGTRPIVRVFGGRVAENLCDSVDFVEEGYASGVPMGGDMGPDLGKFAPRIAVLAQKDPGTMAVPGTQLQRIQIIKGWVDSEGGTQEVVYDVAGDADSTATVDPSTCTTSGPGFDTLCTVWQDPKFDATQNAFYYARVVENPVCRWSQRLCNELGVTCSGTTSTPAGYNGCCNPNVEDIIQERAIASPIWYHADRLGLTKGSVKFSDTASKDRLQLALMIPSAPEQLDPAVNDLTIAVRDDATAFTVTIPAGTMEVKKPGAKYLYKDPAGTRSGVTGLQLKISKGKATLKLKTGDTDLSSISRSAQTLSVDLTTSTYSSTTVRDWSFAAPKLSLVF